MLSSPAAPVKRWQPRAEMRRRDSSDVLLDNVAIALVHIYDGESTS